MCGPANGSFAALPSYRDSTVSVRGTYYIVHAVGTTKSVQLLVRASATEYGRRSLFRVGVTTLIHGYRLKHIGKGKHNPYTDYSLNQSLLSSSVRKSFSFKVFKSMDDDSNGDWLILDNPIR
jgi:hypothetical protein